MVTQLQSPEKSKVIYPDDNGEPMSDNTEQFRLIVWIKENLELLFASMADVFVAGNLLWYPVEGNNKIAQAPDVMVAFGRPKGYRGSYQQWHEDNIPPQVAFEIWSRGNRLTPMLQKLRFYEQYGIEEYYLYDPANVDLTIWQRREERLEPIEQVNGWVSPRMGVRFQVSETELEIFRPDGTPFVSFVELAQLREQAESRAEQEQQRAEQEQQRAEQAESRAEQERQRTQQAETMLEQERSRSQALEARLRDMGIDPNQL
ncbi:Uma2 family endonuclease [Lyngbya sp. CCAP 1446/10]|uniref:Uma2 family endonuclease n=1 Tax=Microcoleaceae TaxID=1892252 RepID=UPI0022383D8C|nr:Uma2 family endonuclease [Lyngbya sp. CCAP 1446/10]MCW6051238.1 Uma2 family endonuclease [Lyngbya sp. CCAP 1446/10]